LPNTAYPVVSPDHILGGSGGRLISLLDEKYRRLKERTEGFISSLPADMQRPRECQGQECQGKVYKWRGPLDLADRDAGWNEYFCECGLGQQLQVEDDARLLAEEKRIRAEKLLASSNLPLTGKFEAATLTSFRQTLNGSARWVGVVSDWANDWKDYPVTKPKTGLVLFGSFGVGKTGLVIAAMRHIIGEYGVSVHYTTVAEFVDNVGKAWRERDGSEYGLFDRMERAGVLVLDDMGAGHGSIKDWDDKSPMSKLFERIDRRYREEKPIVITTNCYDPAELEGVIGPRNMNRIADMCRFELCEGKNLRHRMMEETR
jgi:DNA replication protein DnaC